MGGEKAVNGTEELGQEKQSTRFLTAQEVEDLPDLEWLIRGVLPKPGFGVLFGEPGSGKTFVALSLALSLTKGGEWAARPIQKANVLYIAAEGIYGLKLRVSAFRKTRGIDDDKVRFTAWPINVLEPSEVKSILVSLGEIDFHPDLIIVDTLARVSVGADENSSKDMGRAVAGLDRLKTAFNAFVLVVHHTTKGGGSERGSSALRGAADVMIECVASETLDGPAVELKCSKMKDAEPFKDISVSLDKVELSDGVTSLVVGDLVDTHSLFSSQNVEKIIELVESEFSKTGATYTELLEKSKSIGIGSKSTFDRAFRRIKEQSKLKIKGKGRGSRYYPLGVSTKSVS